MLEERKGRLETTVNTLEKEHASLVASLEASTLTDEQIKSIRQVADKIKKGLEIAENNFDARRRMVGFLDVWTTLVVEDGEKVAHTRCRLPGTEATLSVSQNTCIVGHGTQNSRVLTARLVLPDLVYVAGQPGRKWQCRQIREQAAAQL